MQTRFVRAVGMRASLRVYWGDVDSNACPNCVGGGKPGYHNAHVHLMDGPDPKDFTLGGDPKEYADERWPTKCDHCPAEIPPVSNVVCSCGCGEMVPAPGSPKRQVFHTVLYGTPDGSWVGKPQPGDVFYADWYHHNGKCLWWDNCYQPHLICILPNGDQWDTNSRASNCTMKEDRMHRCWVLAGSAEHGTAHVDKNGRTCAAGAGSIVSGDFHGFLHNGQITGC